MSLDLLQNASAPGVFAPGTLRAHTRVHDHDLSAGIPPEYFEVYLTRVEADFTSARRVMHGLGAVLLLVQSTRTTHNPHIEVALNDLTTRVERVDTALQELSPRLSAHRAHGVLLRAVELIRDLAQLTRSAFEANAEDRGRAVARALDGARSAYSALGTFTIVTPWHVLSLSNGCACAPTQPTTNLTELS